MRRISPDCLQPSPEVREIVLNEASFPRADVVERRVAMGWLSGLSRGIAYLTKQGVVAPTLRTRASLSQVPLGHGVSVMQCLIHLARSRERDDALFLLRLGSKSPLLTDLGAEVVDRFRGCEARGMEPPDGEPLVLCAHLDAVAAGVPSNDAWDRDTLTVRFDELQRDGSLREVEETIDHVARQCHAQAIRFRHVGQLRTGLTHETLWVARSNAFPNLVFGLDVEDQIKRVATATFPTVIRRLSELDQAAAEWRGSGGPAPPWKSKVTGESSSVMADPRLRRARRFRLARGGSALFEWHARFGASGRIHLRFTPSRHEVEIGYIGPHLPR